MVATMIRSLGVYSPLRIILGLAIGATGLPGRGPGGPGGRAGGGEQVGPVLLGLVAGVAHDQGDDREGMNAFQSSPIDQGDAQLGGHGPSASAV